MNSFRLWMTWMNLADELKPVDTMNSLGLLFTWKNLGRKLKALMF